ncbi:unnamed protein product [Rotaria socialis]|uniref:Uncharacterized protein n=1 Tax=Rotaria socialis TaxID=392032 RepID=A0A820JMH3_9BILA|nr:unnamed protein product [Rotaria socialis]CAF3453230.1 unnamed protein product [Rotaria socialis]CAF3592737.1 unnamed protein product [Rotaria socialis]CAF3709475.1 unnamed protein product [Rotaria socialis]CAF4324015.1 unnamed protein product [Rotaria socialis]
MYPNTSGSGGSGSFSSTPIGSNIPIPYSFLSGPYSGAIHQNSPSSSGSGLPTNYSSNYSIPTPNSGSGAPPNNFGHHIAMYPIMNPPYLGVGSQFTPRNSGGGSAPPNIGRHPY